MPPQQHASFTAPETGLPAEVTGAFERIFEQGLADPRGCQYRRVRIETGESWRGGGKVREVGAWLLPVTADEEQRYAVAWNGLVYPVQSIGPAAALEADVQAMLQADPHGPRALRRGEEYAHRSRWIKAWEDFVSVSHQRLLPVRAALLYRLGRGELAAQAWLQWSQIPAIHERKPFEALATDFVWALYNRAICAHMRGDDALARSSVRQAMAAWTGTPVQRHVIESAPALYRDQLRREPRGPLAVTRGRQVFANQQEWIAALIGDLQEFDGRMMGQPGGILYAANHTFQVLRAMGDEAVAPLLDCLRHDQRLTRSVWFGRNFHYKRSWVSVRRVAKILLEYIFGYDQFPRLPEAQDLSPEAEEKRRQVAEQMARWWKANAGLSPSMRWYRVLRNDDAEPEAWREAADRLTAPDHESGKLDAQDLPSDLQPTLAQVLAGRIRQLSKQGSDASQHDWNLERACAMALDLSRLDPSMAVPVQWDLIAIARQLDARENAAGNNFDRCIYSLYMELFAHGEAKALEDYAAWIKDLASRRSSLPEMGMLAPLVQYPDHPTMRRLAAWIFGRRGSPWLPVLDKEKRPPLADMLTSWMLKVEAFRKRVLRMLSDKRPAGRVVPVANDQPELRSDKWWTGTSPVCNGELDVPERSSSFRVCDLYAYHLSIRSGTPKILLHWSRPRRDRVIGQLKAFLRRFGSNPELHFPERNRPATAAEVRRGEAIFHLKQPGARVVELPRLPLRAHWEKLKDCRTSQTVIDRVRDEEERHFSLEQGGKVWQAEEIPHRGGFKRYYGFVWRYGVARVPADELFFEVLGQQGEELSVQLLRPDPEANGIVDPKSGRANQKTLRPDRPLVVGLLLSNHTGYDRLVPRWSQALTPAQARAAGIRPRLFRQTSTASQPAGQGGVQEKAMPPLPIADQAPEAVPQMQRQKLLPGERGTIFTLDLNRFFPQLAKGSYRLELVLEENSGLPAGSYTQRPFAVGQTGD